MKKFISLFLALWFALGAPLHAALWTVPWKSASLTSAYIVATGGTVTTSGNYKTHTFTSGGTFTVTSAPVGATVNALVVAGGGGGGGSNLSSGGGGGAGGYIQNSAFGVTAGAFTITVGSGGSAGAASGGTGGSGTNSVFSTNTAVGGGGGGGGTGASVAGLNGGSGGGGGAGTGAGGTGTAGQGNAGATGPGGSNSGGGGGQASAGLSINAGVGLTFNGVRYADGGGGGNGGAAGGSSGGAGGVGTAAGSSAPANQGGGGGGASSPGTAAGGAGGSGVVIITYLYQSSAYVTAFAGSTLRNDVTGAVGMKFTASSSFTITQLGRWVVSGNSGSHTIYVYAADDTTVIGSVTVNTSGAATAAYLYATLGTPISIITGTNYSIVSTETNAGDQWYDAAAATYTSGVTSVLNPAYYLTSPPIVGVSNLNNIFGPVNFIFQ